MPRPSAPDLAGLIARARAADGQPPFSDQALVDLRSGARTLLTSDHAAAIVGDGEVEFVVEPGSRGAGHGTAMLDRVLAHTAGPVLAWAHGDHPAARALAASHGFSAVRELLQLRAELPGRPDSVPTVVAPLGIAIQPFRAGTDEPAWVELNARAFPFHPEQGSVGIDDVLALEAEEWFDAHDFLLAWAGDDLVGYCWLKAEGGVGEIYVIGVDPARQGGGLGRALMTAGLARLAERGIRTAALYVEGDNAPALALYASLGFTTHSRDLQYRLDR